MGIPRILVASLVVALAGLAVVQQAQANSLHLTYQFNGQGNWSLDAVGGNNTPVGIVQADVPAGSTVVRAYLYSARTPFTTGAPTIGFAGTTIPPAAFTSLGVNAAALGLEAFRADVTAQVAAAIGGGGGIYNFQIDSESANSAIDGEALVVIYSNPAEVVRTIAILDGFSDSNGDTTTFNFAQPVDPSVAGFEATMSLGIGFGAQGQSGAQYSIVDVNGTRLTSWAGGEDDGSTANGALITMGGLGDSTTNPADPFAMPLGDIRYDDELYNVVPFLTLGDTQFKVDTSNPSDDDNVFFLGLNVTAEGNVNPVIPEPISMAGLLLGVGALGRYLRKRR